MRSLLTLSAVLALAACGPTLIEPEKGDSEQHFIFHGSPTSQAYHEATVSLHQVSGWGVSDPFCTGTLIFDKWVLTAAHCADGQSASGVVVHFGDDGRRLDSDRLHEVRRITMHPSYDPWRIQNDVALLELTSAVHHTAPVMPLPASIGLTSGDRGEIIDLAGFGFQEDGGYADLLHVEVPIAQVRNTEIEYDQGSGWGNGTGGACNGDSGGPAFFERDGEVYVAGVTSYGDANCTDFGVSLKVDAFESFIESTTGRSVEVVGGGSSPGNPGNPGTTPPTGGDVTESYTGSVSQGYLQPYVYRSDDGGVHDIVMTGPPGTDFDLYFAQKINGQWTFLAEATTPSSSETLRVDMPAGGRFAIGVASYSGSGTYAVEVTRPQ